MIANPLHFVPAICTAKWLATFEKTTANPELDREIEYATFLASRVMSSWYRDVTVCFRRGNSLGISLVTRMCQSDHHLVLTVILSMTNGHQVGRHLAL